jgi:hypothetical protein
MDVWGSGDTYLYAAATPLPCPFEDHFGCSCEQDIVHPAPWYTEEEISPVFIPEAQPEETTELDAAPAHDNKLLALWYAAPLLSDLMSDRPRKRRFKDCRGNLKMPS